MISNASFRVEINRTTHDGQADFSQGCAPCIGAGEGHDRFYPGEFAELVHQAAGVLDIIEEADCDDVIEGLLRFETHDVNAFEAAFIGQAPFSASGKQKRPVPHPTSKTLLP